MATHALPKLSLRRACCAATPSSAPALRTFFQLAPQRPAPAAPVLDFLLPRMPPRSILKTAPRPVTRLPSSRTFSASPLRATTTTIYNPRKDDDGNDMTIEITPRAAERLHQIMTRDSNPRLALRITVSSGGCHGFQYTMSLTNVPPIDSATGQPVVGAEEPHEALTLDEEDVLFEAAEGAKVVMDAGSLELLKGSKVDFTRELIGSQFKIAENPLATSSCGCGTSFDVKF